MNMRVLGGALIILALCLSSLSVSGGNDGLAVLTLSKALPAANGEARDLVCYLAGRGAQWTSGTADSPQWNSASHDVDASGLAYDGNAVRGTLKVTLQPDQWHPKAPVACQFSLTLRIGGDTKGRGSYEGKVGDQAVKGSLRADLGELDLSDAAYARGDLWLLVQNGALFGPNWDRDVALLVHLKDGKVAVGAAYRGAVGAVDASGLKLTADTLKGECTVNFKGQPACTFRLDGKVAGPYLGGGVEVSAAGAEGGGARRFRGYFEAPGSAATQPVAGQLDPSPLRSARRLAMIERLKGMAGELADAFEARELRQDGLPAMPYRLFRPRGYEPARKYPLVVFLHGADARGADNVKNYTHHGMLLGARLWALDHVQRQNPCFIIAPQTTDRWEGDAARAVLAIVDAVEKEFGLDSQRVYLTGLSLGGYGTFGLLAQAPHRWAAAVPVCGGGDPQSAVACAATPMWVFHGADDNLVKPEESRRIVQALRAAGAKPIHTEYPGIGHNSYLWAYSEPSLPAWLFAQRRK